MLKRPSRAAFLALCAATAFSAPVLAKPASGDDLATLKAQVQALSAEVRSTRDRAAVENLFSTYMYLHNAFRDEDIIPLWAKKGTPGVRAQYSNIGVYTDWDKIISYHQGRPAPSGISARQGKAAENAAEARLGHQLGRVRGGKPLLTEN